MTFCGSMPYKDKNKRKECNRKDYLKNKERYYENSEKRRGVLKLKKRAYVNEYLLTHPCVDCGETDIIVLEFDHVRGEKYNNISNLVIQDRSFEKLKLEILKCDVRCANCHRRITHKRRQTR